MQYLNQCEELSNHYLGFSGWTSETLYHQKETETEAQITYGSAVKLTFRKQKHIESEQAVEGVGIGQVDYKSLQEKVQNSGMGHKVSRTAAMINAFSKVILVLLYSSEGSLKVTLRIDNSHKDPFYYNSIWDKPAIESVNELDEEPEFED